jgi:hypothetical protein
MNLDEFKLLAGAPPPRTLSAPLTALLYDARDDWESAHDWAQKDTCRGGAWVHAYLHRKEGDIPNAAYWYWKAGQPLETGSSENEWDRIAAALLAAP